MKNTKPDRLKRFYKNICKITVRFVTCKSVREDRKLRVRGKRLRPGALGEGKRKKPVNPAISRASLISDPHLFLLFKCNFVIHTLSKPSRTKPRSASGSLQS